VGEDSWAIGKSADKRFSLRFGNGHLVLGTDYHRGVRGRGPMNRVQTDVLLEGVACDVSRPRKKKRVGWCWTDTQVCGSRCNWKLWSPVKRLGTAGGSTGCTMMGFENPNSPAVSLAS